MFLCPTYPLIILMECGVIGGSGVYYVNFPGIPSPNWVGTMEGIIADGVPGGNLNPFAAVEDNPADVEGKAQVKAGKGLYNKLGAVPYGTIVMVLPDDGTGYFAADPFFLTIGPGLYRLYPQFNGASVNTVGYPEDIGMPIPLMGELYADVPLKLLLSGNLIHILSFLLFL